MKCDNCTIQSRLFWFQSNSDPWRYINNGLNGLKVRFVPHVVSCVSNSLSLCLLQTTGSGTGMSSHQNLSEAYGNS